MSVCAVVITHLALPRFSNLITVPYIVTTDAAEGDRPAAGAWFIDTSGQSGETKIGAHIHGAIDQAFATFPDCTVLAVLEDDVEVAADYFRMIAALAGHIEAGYAFCPLNDYYEHPEPPQKPDLGTIKLTTHAIGLGMAFSRESWKRWRWPWGYRHWDNFLRATRDIVCLTPIVSRIKHHSTRNSVHGINTVVDKLPMASPYYGEYTIVEPPVEDVTTPPCRAIEGLRGTYYGLVARSRSGRRRSRLPAVCRAAKMRSTYEMEANWTVGSTGQSCEAVCEARGLSCSHQMLQLDAASFLVHWKGCDEYGAEMGVELPSSIIVDGRRRCNVPFITERRGCTGSHRDTQRLCPCYTATRHNRPYY